MMKAADDWQRRDDPPLVRALHWHRGLLAESLVRACAVVADLLGDDALEVSVVKHQDLVEALATQEPRKSVHGPRSCLARASRCEAAASAARAIRSTFLQVGVNPSERD
jgi:hypothetical protein